MKVDVAKENRPFSEYPEGTIFVLDEAIDPVEKDFLEALGVSEEEFMAEVMEEHKRYLEKLEKEEE